MSETELVNLTLRDLLWHSTVRIEYKNTHYGTGFFVTPEYVVTCAHVVKNIKAAMLTLKLRNGISFDAIVIATHPQDYQDNQINYPDLALLKVADGQYNDCYVVLCPTVNEGDKLSSDGFPENNPEGYGLITSYEGMFQVEGYNYPDFMRLSKGQVQQGFSGSPLFNSRTGAVCGLMKFSRDFKTDLGGHGVSASLILHYFKEQLEIAQSPAQIKKTPWAVLRLLSKAANNGNVSEPVTLSNFIKHWTNWSSKKLEVYDADGLFGRNIEVDSPLETYWQTFIEAPAWRTELFERFETYKEAIRNSGFEEMPSLLPDIKGSYEQVQKKLEIWLKDVKPIFNPLASSAKNIPDEQMWKNIDSLKRTLNFIETMSNSSRAQLQIGFLIFGAQGCGKTQFFRTRQSNINYFKLGFNNSEWIPLLLPLEAWSMETNLEKLILTNINEASCGYDWQSLDELDTFFSAINLKLVIMVDDFDSVLHDLTMSKNVRNFMISNTRLDSLFYLFAVKDTNMDVVANTYSDLWTLLSFWNRKLVECMAGWINLNDLNRQEKIGFKILKEANKDNTAEQLEERGDLDSPLIAQIVLELIKEKDIDTVVSLNFIEFIATFWKILKKREEMDEDKILELISCVICAIFESSSIKPSLNNIQKCLQQKDLPSSEDERPIKNLKSVSLLRVINSSNNSFSCFNKSDKQVQLNYTFFWNRFIAEQIWYRFNPISDSQQQKAINWLREVINDKTVMEGIWEFVLLWADNVGKDKTLIKPERVHSIWLLAFDIDNINLICAPCFAARWASKHTQKAIALALISGRQSITLVDRRALFALIFFAIETPALKPQIRFKLLRPFYQAINEMSLTDYFIYGAKKILKGLTEKSDLYNCLSELANSHLTGCTSKLASISWCVFVKLHDKEPRYVSVRLHDEWVKNNLEILMSRFLLNDNKNAIEEHKSWNKEKGRCPLFFREELIFQALLWVWRNFNSYKYTEENKTSIRQYFDLLKEIGWYNSIKRHKMGNIVSEEMKEQANRAFGNHFRWLLRQYEEDIESSSDIREYKMLVNNLLKRKEQVEGVSLSEELGYFMIRQSGLAQKEGKTISIPSVLWDEFEIASRISSLKFFFYHYPMEKEKIC